MLSSRLLAFRLSPATSKSEFHILLLPHYDELILFIHCNSTKAAAEGAVRWQLSQQVIARVVRASYGRPIAIKYASYDPEHRWRPLHTWPDGIQRVQGFWAPIVEKVGDELSLTKTENTDKSHYRERSSTHLLHSLVFSLSS